MNLENIFTLLEKILNVFFYYVYIINNVYTSQLNNYYMRKMNENIGTASFWQVE